MHFLETPAGIDEIKRMSRRELWDYLEHRGFACYSSESTKLLRDCALEDSDPNYFRVKS
jgi:hypothetical protein